MEYVRIKTVSETDFDKLITSAGGSRIVEEDSADYRLNEAIIELKLVSEEGFEKTERQKKLAALFRKTQPKTPVVILKPGQLSEENSRDYYRIVETPIKNACKKASKQLQKTAARHNQQPLRVLRRTILPQFFACLKRQVSNETNHWWKMKNSFMNTAWLFPPRMRSSST